MGSRDFPGTLLWGVCGGGGEGVDQVKSGADETRGLPQPMQDSKPTVRCLWSWSPLQLPEEEAYLLSQIGEDSPPPLPESEHSPTPAPIGRQRRYPQSPRTLCAPRPFSAVSPGARLSHPPFCSLP